MWLIEHFRLSKRLLAAEEAITEAQRQLKEQSLDFEELYDRCKRLLGRTVKERARIEAAQQAEAAAPDSPLSTGNGRLPHGGLLTDRQRELQQQILRRRGGL
jgi:hypothetical protein